MMARSLWSQALFLLPLWEKVAIGGLRPPFFKTPMLRIGYAKSATDEGSLSASGKGSLSRGDRPLTRIASNDAIRPLPQGERWTVSVTR